MAMIYKKTGNIENQIKFLELGVVRCPDIQSYEHALLAIAYQFDAKNPEKARQTWGEIVRNNPELSYAKIELAKMYHDTDPQKAKDMYE